MNYYIPVNISVNPNSTNKVSIRNTFGKNLKIIGFSSNTSNTGIMIYKNNNPLSNNYVIYRILNEANQFEIVKLRFEEQFNINDELTLSFYNYDTTLTDASDNVLFLIKLKE